MSRAQGADLSHWQSDPTFAAAIKGKDFVGIKATDGTSHDPEFNDSDDHRWTTLGSLVDKGTLAVRMAYLFLELGISGSAQVDELLATAGNPTASTRMALDWEASALANPSLLGAAGRHLWDRTKIAFLVYCSDSNVPAAAAALAAEGMKAGTHFFWWIARYGAMPAHAWTFWQDVGVGIDHDQFYEDRATLDGWTGATSEEDDVGLTKDQEATLTKMAGEQHGEQDAWDGKNAPTPMPGEGSVGPFVYIGFNRVRAMLGKPLVGVK